MTSPSSPEVQRSKLSLYLDLIRFNRPAGWLVLIWPTLAALWIAADGFPGWHLLLVFALGTVLMRSAGCTINDIADRDFDKHVKRTTQRPITSGQVSVKEAAMVGLVLTLVSFFLVLSTRWEAVAWSVPAVLFTILYPFTKRFFAMPQAFLGIAFNFGILIAFAAVVGTVGTMAWVLWLANMCLVLAYDTEYAMVDRDDDLKIGIKTSAITLGRFDVLGADHLGGAALWSGLAVLAGHGCGRGAGDLAFHVDPKPFTRRLLCGVQQEPLHWHGHFCGRGAGFCAALSLVRPCEAVRRACHLRAA